MNLDSLRLAQDIIRTHETIKSVVSDSRVLITWSVSIIGGSILAIISTSYFRPVSVKKRLFYLLFLPGWTLLGASIYQGISISISTSYFSKLHVTSKNICIIKDIPGQLFDGVNDDYYYQIKCFKWGLLFFGIWLVFYILYWVFSDSFVKKNE